MCIVVLCCQKLSGLLVMSLWYLRFAVWIYEELFDDDSAKTLLESTRDYDSSYDYDDCEEVF